MTNKLFRYRHTENRRITTLYTRTETSMKKEDLRKRKMKWREDTGKTLMISRWTTRSRRIRNKKTKAREDTHLMTKNSPLSKHLWDLLACSTFSSIIINLFLNNESFSCQWLGFNMIICNQKLKWSIERSGTMTNYHHHLF